MLRGFTNCYSLVYTPSLDEKLLSGICDYNKRPTKAQGGCQRIATDPSRSRRQAKAKRNRQFRAGKLILVTNPLPAKAQKAGQGKAPSALAVSMHGSR